MRLISISFFLLFFVQSLIAQNKLNEEYLNKDRQILNNFLPVLRASEFDLTTLGQINGIEISNRYGNLGLGYNKTTYYQNGGYTALSIKMLLDPNNLIVKYKITISANLNVFDLLNENYNLYSVFDHYKKNIYFNSLTNSDRIILELERTNNELFLRMMRSFNEYLGINKEIHIPSNLYNDYCLLTDPFNDDVYGFGVGIGADIPNSRSAIERIKSANNNDILMLIMASPNEAMNYISFFNEDDEIEIKSNEDVYRIIIVGGIIAIIGIGLFIYKKNGKKPTSHNTRYTVGNYAKRLRR
jgi:hypothetical protein